MSFLSNYLQIHDEVLDAFDNGIPVVALESTIISHGMPYPENLKCAEKLSGIIRDAGCVPALVAVDSGKLNVGVETELLEKLASKQAPVLKVSRRDMPVALESGAFGATTVCGTLIACHLAGIRVFVTGGIGGVHRGAEQSFDISADLEELAISNVAVVSAGGTISHVYVTHAGSGYVSNPTITIGSPYMAGEGTFIDNETVIGSSSSITALVKTWNAVSGELVISNSTGEFVMGENITGQESGAVYQLSLIHI